MRITTFLKFRQIIFKQPILIKKICLHTAQLTPLSDKLMFHTADDMFMIVTAPDMT